MSLLHPPGGEVTGSDAAPPPDLGLDRVAAALLAGRGEFHLDAWFNAPLRTVEAVEYRQEAMRDLERPEVRHAAREFTAGLGGVRSRLGGARSFEHPVQRNAALLDAALTYTGTVATFAERLDGVHPTSRALTALADHLQSIATSPAFTGLAEDAAEARAAVAGITYRLHLSTDRVQVSAPTGQETDYSAVIEAVFERFRQGSIRSHVGRTTEHTGMNHLEAAIAERVATLYPDRFELLDRFAARHRDFVDPSLLTLDAELQFLLVGLSLADRLRAMSLPACWPVVSRTDRTIELVAARDPALALAHRDAVANDVLLAAGERIAVITGPNQGGKTTFARMIGAITHLAALGFPVPAERARLPLPDAVLTHFGRAEDLADLRGALEDDLVRLRDILGAATADSLVILNELFSSTTVADAEQLSRATLERLVERGCRCLWVTFLTELAETPGVVSLVSQVDPDDPGVRTFRVLRQDPGGPTWAETLAVAAGLDRAGLRRRLSP